MHRGIFIRRRTFLSQKIFQKSHRVRNRAFWNFNFRNYLFRRIRRKNIAAFDRTFSNFKFDSIALDTRQFNRNRFRFFFNRDRTFKRANRRFKNRFRARRRTFDFTFFTFARFFIRSENFQNARRF